MTHLYLIRHGANIDGLEDGKYRDLGLSPEGVMQAERLRDRLLATQEIRPDVFIASPERRAHETAKILLPAIGQPITLDSDVEEWRTDDGTITPEDFMAQWHAVPEHQKGYYRWIPEGETRVEFVARVQQTLNRILQTHAGKTILIVSHGAFIQTAFLFFFGYGEASLRAAGPEIAHTGITHWYQPNPQGRWILERSNDYHHLKAGLKSSHKAD